MQRDVATEQKIKQARDRAEALARSKAEFKAIFHLISDAVLFADTDRSIIMCNPATSKMFGYSDDELIGNTTEMLYADPADFKDQGQRRYRTGPDTENTPYEVRYKHKDGNIFWAETVGTQIVYPDGTVLGFIGMCRDISQRKQTEAKLLNSESLLVEAQRLAHLGSWELELDSHKATWSEEEYRLLGYEPYSVDPVPDNFIDRIHPEDKAHVLQELERPFQEKDKKYYAEFRIVLPGNKIRIVADRGKLIYDEQGKAQRYVGTTLDITEHKLAEEKIKASEQELSDILNSMQDTYYRVDPEGYLTRVSPSVQKLLGYCPEQLQGTKLADLYVDPKGREKFLAQMEEQNGVVENYEAQLWHIDGSPVWVSTNAHYIQDKQGNPIGIEGTTRDIGQIKAAEDLRHRFGRILDNSSNEIYVFDAETLYFTQVNKGARNNLGYSMDEMSRLTPVDLKPDYTWELFNKTIQPLSQGKQEQLVFQTQHQRKNGTLYPVEVRLQLSHEESPPVYVAVILDISERIQNEKKLQHLAHHDALTSLPNRVLFNDRLEQSLMHANRHNRAIAVLFLDLDRFKVINDTLGHDVGDLALQALSQRLVSCVRKGDTVSRLGGDEFAIILEDVISSDDVAPTARKILEVLSQPFPLREDEFIITTSIGISLYPSDGNDTQTLLKHADIAMYRAKDTGRNTYQFYSADMSAKAFERLSLETSLRHALEREEFILYYQPQINLHNGKIFGVEALLRWQHPELGIISPTDFVPLLEETGLILPVGEWVAHTACLQAHEWNNNSHIPLRLSVNLSARQITNSNFISTIKQVLESSKFDPTLLELEMTESILMHNLQKTVRTLQTISEMGVRLAIDDFGTGYSSLSYLKRFPIDTLKIDRSFVHDLPHDTNDATLVEAIIAMGRALQLNIIAEGVETKQQVDFLKMHNCDNIQGFLISQPLPAKELTRFLQENN